MSDSDLEESPNTRWFDSESDLPGISSVNSTIEQGVSVSSLSADQIHVRALNFGDSSAKGPAPNRGTPVGHAPLEGTEPSKGESFLDTPIHTTPQRSLHHLNRFIVGGPWVEGGGWDERGRKVLQYEQC